MKKMKFPKSVIIGGIPWVIEFDKKIKGGEFYWRKHLIKIESGYSDDRKFQVLIHEVVEAILVNNTMRYNKNFSEINNGDYLFSFNHDQFEIFTDELSGVLRQIGIK